MGKGAEVLHDWTRRTVEVSQEPETNAKQFLTWYRTNCPRRNCNRHKRDGVICLSIPRRLPQLKCFLLAVPFRRAGLFVPSAGSYFTPQLAFRHSLAEMPSIFLKTLEKWAVSA